MVHSAARAILAVPWWVWLVAIIALAPRLLLVPYGLPYELDPDEQLFVDAAWAMVEGGAGDPAWYNTPASTLMDLMAGAYALSGAVGVAVGGLDSVSAAGDAYHADVSHFFLIGRLIAALSGLGVVLLTYVVAREIRISPLWATVAALALALSFAMISFSALVRPDMLMSMFLLAAILVGLRLLVRPSGWMHVPAGVMLGLAAASKYPGALAVVPIVAANATLVLEGRVTPRRGLGWLAVAGSVGVVTAFVVGPYLFIHADQTVWAIGQEARSSHVGATGSGFTQDLWRYLTEAMPWGLGEVTAVLAIVGLVAMLLARRPRVVAVTFWLLLAFISFLSLWWLRWVLPLLPLGAIGAAWLVDRGQRRLAGRWGGPRALVVGVLVAAAMLLPVLGPTIDELSARVAGDDTRLLANAWIDEHIPRGSSLLIDSYSAQVSSDDYDLRVLSEGEILPWSDFSEKTRPQGYFGLMGGQWFGGADDLVRAIDDAGIDYVVLSDVWIDLVRREADAYPLVLARYEALLDAYPVTQRFDREQARLGFPVSILAVSGLPG